MSYDPDRPQPEREPESSGPWLPPRIERGPVNPPETYRKTKAHVKVRDVHPSRWTRRDVYKAMPYGSIVASAKRVSPDVPVGARFVGRTRCPKCHHWVMEVIRQAPTAPRYQEWVCAECTPERIRRMGATNWDVSQEEYK